MTRIVACLLFLWGVAMSPVALADDLHRITGFRSAEFGMTPEALRAAIARDFPSQAEAMVERENPREGTRIVSIALPELVPGPGPARVHYVLGASSGRLMQVNVVWATSDTPSDEERNRIGIAGSQLARYFMELKWKPEGAVAGLSLKPNEVMLFTGVDPVDAGVEILATGVPMTNAQGEYLTPTGPAVLRISYMARYGQPDILPAPSSAEQP